MNNIKENLKSIKEHFTSIDVYKELSEVEGKCIEVSQKILTFLSSQFESGTKRKIKTQYTSFETACVSTTQKIINFLDKKLSDIFKINKETDLGGKCMVELLVFFPLITVSVNIIASCMFSKYALLAIVIPKTIPLVLLKMASIAASKITLLSVAALYGVHILSKTS